MGIFSNTDRDSKMKYITFTENSFIELDIVTRDT